MGRKRTGEYKRCFKCGKIFYTPKSYIGKRGKFCSRQCYMSFLEQAVSKHYEEFCKSEVKDE